MEQKFPNLRHLNICLSVAKTGSISSASRHVHLSQPAISQAIAKMENSLETALFSRHSAGMFVTSIGKSYFNRVERALDLLRQGAAKCCAQAGSSGTSSDFHRYLTASQLKALIAVSHTGNFTIAAQNTGISQPTLHRAARDLEKLSGMSLFNAHQRGVMLTKPARTLVRYARLAAAELRHASSEIHENLNKNPVRLHIGSLPLARTRILPVSIEALIEKYNNVQVHIIEGAYNEQLNKLRHGDIDFIIGALRNRQIANDIVQETLFVDRLVIVVRKSHPLTRSTNVTITDLSNYAWIAPSRDTPTGQYLFEKLGIADMRKTPVKVVSSSLRLVRSLLLSGDYVTIISNHQIEKELQQGILTAIPIDMDDSEREIGLTYRKSWQPTLMQKHLLDIIRAASSGKQILPFNN